MEIKQFGIRFGDNDFYNTFINLVKYIGISITEDDVDFTPDQLLKIINSLSYGTYLLYQSSEYEDTKEDFIREYLLIDESKLLINEDLDKYILETGRHNSDCYFLVLNDYGPDEFTVGSI